VFSIKPKMAVFYATGKNENFLFLDRNSGLGLGGKPGCHGFGLSASMETVTYNEEVETFDLVGVSRVCKYNHKQTINYTFDLARV
jgi:hypothetical protein